ncbi:hypothetical protein LTR85_006890 [Meristemomyces frigidus]|nr:hypothetical protein LTR85_006890 [Meristemomyces frigidus]
MLAQRSGPPRSRAQALYNTVATRHFHQTSHRRDDGMPNHYATLDLQTNATPAEIKKQFYKLSKAHHPDLHPDDPNASQRFVQISEAHATLASPDKKTKYDRDFLRTQAPSSSGGHPTGSYSSHSNPAGGRPASGLSRRRTQFRGPPPSFYRSGGWGEHSEKRAEHSEKASNTHEARGSSSDGPAGTGPGGFTTGVDNDVRHFDHHGHYRTHSTIERTRHKARRKQYQSVSEDDLDYSGGSSVMFNFVLMSGVLASIFGISYGLFGYGSSSSASSASSGKKKVGKDDGA